MDHYELIALGFFVVMIAAVIYGRVRRMPPREVAGILPVLGILGTFTGIAVGLFLFDPRPEHIKDSVPALLGGMKTAFITSIFGIAFSVLIRFFPGLAGKGPDAKTGATADTIATLLDEQNRILRKDSTDDRIATLLDEQNQLLRKDSTDAAGRHEALLALLGELHNESASQKIAFLEAFDKIHNANAAVGMQIEQHRHKADENAAKLKNSFDTFAERLAEWNTDALVKALTGVIRDFNQKLTEQFGENFKRLNEAVGKLLVWQDNYKAQVEQLTAAFDTAVANIQKVANSLEQIESRISGILEVSKQLGRLLTSFEQIKDDIGSRLQAFKHMADRAAEALPTVQSSLNRMTEEYSKSVTAAVARADEATKAQEISLNVLTSTINSTLESMKAQVEKSTADNSEFVRRAGTELNKNMMNMQNQLNQVIQKTAEALRDQTQKLDEELGRELTKSLQTLGTQLASLSSTFVNDYQPLTERLREVVRIAERTQA